jgi:5-methylcytosine-specific restriction endonuclease McrA
MELPATPEYFYGNKASPDGLYSVCKTCRDDISRKWYEANREQKAELSRQWYQRNVEKAREQNRRYNEANKSRRAARAKLYYRTNKQQINEQNRKWRQNNPTKAQMIVERYRARKQSLPDTFTAEQWIACLEYHHYCCAVCGNQLRDLFGSIVPHADHWIPLSLDECPGTVAENMVCLCSDCNLSKNAKMPDIWLRSRVSTRKANEILARIAAYFEWVICS